MIFFRKIFFSLLILLALINCKKEKSTQQNASLEVPSARDRTEFNSVQVVNDSLITNEFVKIDSVSINEMKRYIDDDLPTIFDYYKQEKIEEYSTWSPKMFGRCCSNTDLKFTENLFFKISSNINGKKYPITNISDAEYLTAFVFKPSDKVKINLYLDKNNSFLKGKYSNKNLLKPDEIIMNPIKLSIINGYVKSEDLFYKNGRVKEMGVYVNNEYKQTITLIDTPLIQEFLIDTVFKSDDTISLVPKTYYKGTKYDDICISEIQTNLGQIALSSLNEKFNLMELLNKK